jgi:hypothetical protein
MTIRTTLMTTLAAAALLSGAALAQSTETDMETDAEGAELSAEEGTDPLLVEEGGEMTAETEAETDGDTTTMTVPIQDTADAPATDEDGTGAMGDEPEMATDEDAMEATDDSTMTAETEGDASTTTVPVESAETDAGEAEATEDTMTAEIAEAGPTDTSGVYGAFGQTLVSDLIGRDVIGADGEDMGEVDQLVNFDGTANAVVGIGGFLGFGEHDVAIPLSNFTMTEEGLMLDSMTEEQLRAMEEWDPALGTEMDRALTVEDAI